MGRENNTFNDPSDVFIDVKGDIYVADKDNAKNICQQKLQQIQDFVDIDLSISETFFDQSDFA